MEGDNPITIGTQGSSSYIPPINNGKQGPGVGPGPQNDDVNSQHSHFAQQQSKRMLNMSENSNNNPGLSHVGGVMVPGSTSSV